MPSRPPLQTGLLAALALATLGCGAGDPPTFEVATYDSAGIRIVQRTPGAWPDGRAWTVDPRPDVVIQGASTHSAEALFDITGALRLADGRIVVGNGGAHELRFFDAAGRPLHSAGAEGEGPGEFPRAPVRPGRPLPQ